MWWLKFLLTGCVVLASSPDDVDKEKQWLTWAQILGGDPPKPLEFAATESYPENSIQEANSNDQDYHHAEEKYNPDYDYPYVDDYDESFFENPDYIYVDTEDENYVPPPKVEKVNSDGNQTADRRTLDFLYHLFYDQSRNGHDDGRPSRDTKKRRPSLIEAVFETIDNHIIEDLREWSSYTPQNDAQVVNSKPTKHDAIAPVSPVIQGVSDDNDIVLVTDEQGHQHVVTINDIVTSLSHLDERTLTNLLLNQPITERSSQSQVRQAQVNPIPNLVFTESQNVPQVLGTQGVGPAGIPVLRPVRHTGPTTTPLPPKDEEDVYIVRDENGDIQLVTLDNIITSLASLDDQSINSLLFGDTTISSVVPSPSSANGISPSISKPLSTVVSEEPLPPMTTTTSVSLTADSQTTTEAPKPKKPAPSPTVHTDENGNLNVLAHPGSITVDLEDLSWYTNNENSKQPLPKDDETKEPKKPAPVYIHGSRVETDRNGDIHITPDPNRPFTLDIHNIIALAEQADNPTVQSDFHHLNPDISNNEEKEPEKQPEKGHEILSYLAGVENFLPAAIIPGPIESTLEKREVSDGPAGVNAFRESLFKAVNQHRIPQQQTTPQPVIQPLIQRLVQPVVQPIVQPIVQAVTQPVSQLSSGSIGSTLSNFISNLVGRPSTSQQIETVSQVVEKPPEEEFIKLVVRQQAPNSFDKHFGEVTIPLPQAIHFQPTTKPSQVTVNTESQISSRVDVPSPLKGLSPLVQRNLQLQVNNVPRFIPPGARTVSAAKTKPVATARSDSGQIVRIERPTHNPNSNDNRRIQHVDLSRSDRRISGANGNIKRYDAGPIIRSDRKIPNDDNIRPRRVIRPSYPVVQPGASNTREDTDRRSVIQPAHQEVQSVTKKPSVSLTSVLQGLPPSVLESIRKQVQNSRIDPISEEETESKEIAEKSESDQDIDRSSSVPKDRSSYATVPEYHSEGGGYGYGPEVYYDDSEKPWFDIYLLADLTKVHKIGDVNLSVKSPIIGDPAYFVKTRHHEYYH